MMRCLLQNSSSSIAVVVPTLNNRKEYLDKALACVVRQSLPPHELIIVNNGRGVLSAPETNFPVTVIKTAYRAGVAQARNIGATFSKAAYVAFLDDDDLWGEDYLEIMSKYIRRHDHDCLIARLDQLLDNNVIPFKNADGKITKEVILVRNPGITGSSVVVKRDSFFSIGGYNPKLPSSEDKALVLDFLLNGFRVSSVPECQAILRQHTNGERLTDADSIAEGIEQFLQHYREEMNLHQQIFNRLKVYRHRWNSTKSPIYLIIYCALILTHRITQAYQGD